MGGCLASRALVVRTAGHLMSARLSLECDDPLAHLTRFVMYVITVSAIFHRAHNVSFLDGSIFVSRPATLDPSLPPLPLTHNLHASSHVHAQTFTHIRGTASASTEASPPWLSQVERLRVWADNDDYIRQVNDRDRPYKLAHNRFSHLTLDEFHRHYRLGACCLDGGVCVCPSSALCVWLAP